MKKYLCILLALVLLTVCTASVSMSLAEQDNGTYEFRVQSINQYGNVILSVFGNTFAGLGFEYGDVIAVGITGQAFEMPVVSNYSDADTAEMLCRVIISEEEDQKEVVLAVNNGDFATASGLAEKEIVEVEPGYVWHYDQNAVITVSMAEKGGYANQYLLRNLEGSSERSDYPDLTDEQYANFRMITTPGIAPYTLYRSSTPIDPSLNRNRVADEALNNAGIVSIINLTDTAEGMKEYGDFGQTYYSERNILALFMPMDFTSEDYQSGVAKAVRYIAESEGPWLIHCKHGKDRTGFLCGILECLTGASFDRVVADYMESYVNLYHLTEGEEKHTLIARDNIVQELKLAFGLEDLQLDDTDLEAEAMKYLLKTGLTREEIDKAMEKLSKGV